MEIKSKKMPKTEKMQKMCILLGAIIKFFRPLQTEVKKKRLILQL